MVLEVDQAWLAERRRLGPSADGTALLVDTAEGVARIEI